MLHAVIMAGGGGTRFWPRRRSNRPKQFLSLVGERPLLQQPLDRRGMVRPWQLVANSNRAMHVCGALAGMLESILLRRIRFKQRGQPMGLDPNRIGRRTRNGRCVDGMQPAIQCGTR